jgi:hypothetical protein
MATSILTHLRTHLSIFFCYVRLLWGINYVVLDINLFSLTCVLIL